MPNILLFNPDNDLALANGNDNYLPPRSAARMAYDLAILPTWWANDGDAVMIPDSSLLYYWRNTLSNPCRYSDIEIFTERSEIPSYPILPWGWNPALVKRLSRMNIEVGFLPTRKQMEEIRRLSGRQTSVRILQELTDDLSSIHPLTGKATLCSSPAEVKRAISFQSLSMLKAPWSGSGKGLRRTSGTYEPPFSGWCERIISQQGSVVVEPLYNKVEDFAMEFYAEGHDEFLSFVGYSHFTTDANGAYEGNVLMADEGIEDYLSSFVPRETLHDVRRCLSVKLAKELSPHYQGYVGVDMMICHSDDTPHRYLLHPCVEVNLRMNMGVVSHILYERYVSPKSHGRFMVEYFPSSEVLNEVHKEKLTASPLVFDEDGRILSGYHPLTPVGPQTQYLAYMEIMPL